MPRLLCACRVTCDDSGRRNRDLQIFERCRRRKREEQAPAGYSFVGIFIEELLRTSEEQPVRLGLTSM